MERIVCQAAENGDIALLKSRLSSLNAPPVDCLNERRYTPLMLAANSSGAFYALQYLLSRGANVNLAHTDSGLTPLHFACLANNIPGAILLLKSGANPSLLDQQNRSTLHYTALAGSPLLANKLLRRTKGSILNIQDTSGYTPLMVASEHGKEEMVRLLLSWKANTILRNKLNHTAIELADWFGHRSLCNVLESYMAAAGQLSNEAQAILAAQAQNNNNNGIFTINNGNPNSNALTNGGIGNGTNGTNPSTFSSMSNAITTGAISPVQRTGSHTSPGGTILMNTNSSSNHPQASTGTGHGNNSSSNNNDITMQLNSFGRTSSTDNNSGSSSNRPVPSSSSSSSSSNSNQYHVHTAARSMGVHLTSSLAITTVGTNNS